MNTIATDPQQAAADEAVGRMVASGPGILTAPAGAAVNEPAHPVPVDRPATVPERLLLALARRTAWRAALASIRAASYADAAPIRTAIEAADSDAILCAVQSLALAEWADRNLGALHSVAHGVNAEIDQEVVNAVYSDPRAILSNLSDQSSDPTTMYLRQQATAAVTVDPSRFDVRGQPAMPRVPVLSALSTVIPR